MPKALLERRKVTDQRHRHSADVATPNGIYDYKLRSPFRVNGNASLILFKMATVSAGYEYVAWGTRHVETPGGARVPVLPADASPLKAKELAGRCRDLGLEPLMMFSTV